MFWIQNPDPESESSKLFVEFFDTDLVQQKIATSCLSNHCITIHVPIALWIIMQSHPARKCYPRIPITHVLYVAPLYFCYHDYSY